MLILITIVITVVIATVLWLAKQARKIAEPQESQQEFPSLAETVKLPPQEVEEQKVLWYNLNGTPYRVYTSQTHRSSAMYIERKKVRNNDIYRHYLTEEQKKQCYYGPKE